METSEETIWGSAQALLRTMLNLDLYRLWFAPLKATEYDGGTLTLEVANDFCEVWLKENYLGLIQDVLAHVAGQSVHVKFKVNAESEVATPLVNGRKPKSRWGSREVDPAEISRDFGLNPRYTFDAFVVGSNNSFAHAAAMAVAQSPGKSYNPLFVYGGTGLGKTHLLNAIGQHAVSHKKGSRVAYLSSEKFTNEYIDAIQNNQLVRFRKKYRQTDVLLIDDIQFLSGKERIQEEFFHTFNALHEAHKQIVMTSDKSANEIPGLEQRLVSRFAWGLVTDLQPPDVEVRVAILRRKGKDMGASLPDEIINFLANRIRSNVRILEGALTRVASYATLTGKQLTIETVEELLREQLHQEGRAILTMEIIQKKVAQHYDIRVSDMTSKRRPESIAFPRQIAMYLSRQMTDNSLTAIGEAFGGRDHGTVLHACRLVRDRMEVDSNVRQSVSYLEKTLLR